MTPDEIATIANNPEVQKSAAACRAELQLLAAEKTDHDFILKAVALLFLEGRGVTLDTILFELQCEQGELETARKELIGIRTEYTAGISGTA